MCLHGGEAEGEALEAASSKLRAYFLNHKHKVGVGGRHTENNLSLNSLAPSDILSLPGPWLLNKCHLNLRVTTPMGGACVRDPAYYVIPNSSKF